MSQQTLESPVPVSAPFQEAEVISNKVDNDGSHYLKVLLLSNKMTGNKWIAPYDKIGNLPKEVIDSFKGLPYVSQHNYEFYDKLDNILYNSGLTDEQINKALIDECRKIQSGYIDHIFMDDPNSSLLYGQVKITDPKENEFIKKYGRPSQNFTSPAISGRYMEDENGYKTYNLETIRAFHLAGVPVPAFPQHEARVRGVCNKGNSESCKRSLAYAGLDSVALANSSSTEPTENVNNTCGCNKNIQDMSTNQQSQPQVTTVTTTPAPSSQPDSNVINASGSLLAGSQNSTQEAIEAARKEAQKVVEENNKKTLQAPKQQESEEKSSDNEYISKLKAELREFKQKAEAEAQRSLDQYNFFLDEILSVHIPKGHFKKEEDFNAEKESMKAFINKYNVNLQDAKWLIIKSAKGIPNQNEEQQGNGKKEGGKHGVGVAGLLSNPTTYNSDIITRPAQQSIPKSGDNSINDDDDFPLGIE